MLTFGKKKFLMAKYEVFKDGKKYFSTEHDSCFYPDDIIKNMISAGYKIYKEGKIYNPKNKRTANVAK